MSHGLENDMVEIGNKLKIMDNEYWPAQYLKINIKRFHVKDDRFSWNTMCNQYVKAAVETVKVFLDKYGKELKSEKWCHKNLLPPWYKPE